MKDKIKIINDYIHTRSPENDPISETYRGGVNEKFYMPFSNLDVKNKWKKYIKENPEGLVDFYIHIPYCYKLCTYCFYYKEKYEAKKLELYLSYLENYLLDFVEVFKNFKFKSLYIGGGTPTVLSEKQMLKLLTFINTNFNFLDGAEKTYEGNPLSFTENKIKLISKMGFNRVSMGVQSLDKKVLENSNREYQNVEMIKDSISNMISNGISNINVDLIVGLKDDDKEKFSFTLREIIKMKPSTITVYWLGPTDIYVNKYFNGDIKAFYSDLNGKIDKFYDYIIENKHTFGKNLRFDIDKKNGHIWSIIINDKKTTKYDYDDFGEGSVFGVGPSARSHIYGELQYKMMDSIVYNHGINNVITIGTKVLKSDEISLYTIKEFRDKTFIDLDKFYERFLVNFNDYFSNELTYFKDNNLITYKDNKVYLDVKVDDKLYYSLFFININVLRDKYYGNQLDSDDIIKVRNQIFELSVKLYYQDKNVKCIIYTNNLINKANIDLYYKLIEKINKIIFIINRDTKDISIARKTIIFLLKSYAGNKK